MAPRAAWYLGRVSRWLLACVGPLFVVLGAAEARADDKQACIEAHASGQELRLDRHWMSAAQKFRECSATACPQPVTLDCTRWHEELRASIPSILVAVSTPDGVDTVEVGLMVDGVRVADRLTTTSLDVDPGEHTVRVERSPWAPVEKKIVVREREKDRRIALRFAPLGPPAATAEKPRSTFAGWALVGVGVAAAGTGAVFGVLGKVREDELAGSPCGQNGTCAHDDVDAVRRRYWVGGVVGGVGVAATAVGLWYLLTRHREVPSAAASLGGLRLRF